MAIGEQPSNNTAYQATMEYRNFWLQDKGVLEHMTKSYLYPYYLRGCDGNIIAIRSDHNVNVDRLLNNQSVKLVDFVNMSKCDDSKYDSSAPIVILPPYKNKGMRPILFVIYSSKEKDEENVKRIKTIIEDVIEETEYEKHNYLIVVHTESESNLYEGIEWIFTKKCG